MAWFSIPFQLFISMPNKLYKGKKSTSVSIGVRGGGHVPPRGPEFSHVGAQIFVNFCEEEGRKVLPRHYCSFLGTNLYLF